MDHHHQPAQTVKSPSFRKRLKGAWAGMRTGWRKPDSIPIPHAQHVETDHPDEEPNGQDDSSNVESAPHMSLVEVDVDIPSSPAPPAGSADAAVSATSQPDSSPTVHASVSASAGNKNAQVDFGVSLPSQAPPQTVVSSSATTLSLASVPSGPEVSQPATQPLLGRNARMTTYKDLPREGLARYCQAVMDAVAADLEKMIKLDITLAAFDSCSASLEEWLETVVGLLEAVEKLHPIIGGTRHFSYHCACAEDAFYVSDAGLDIRTVAVGAFRIAVRMTLKRQENNRKLQVVYMTMVHMMMVLLTLATSVQIERIQTKLLEGTLQEIAEKIHTCRATCKAYAAESLIMKTIRSTGWAEKLQAQINAFRTASDQLHEALQIEILVTFNNIGSKVDEIDRKLEQLLRAGENAKERNLLDIARPLLQAGGEISEDIISQLFYHWKRENDLGEPKWAGIERIEEFKKAVSSEMEKQIVDIIANMKVYIEKSMVTTVNQAAERTVQAVGADVWKAVNDPNIGEIWRRMHWTADSVPAVHFVVALQDYFMHPDPKILDSASNTLEAGDTWAAQYISISRIRPLVEALDADDSGWISIREINDFTAGGGGATGLQRPNDWPLSKWFAFWSAGFPLTCRYYAFMIACIRAKMTTLPALSLPPNRDLIDAYLRFGVLRDVDLLVHGVLTNADLAPDSNTLRHFIGHTSEQQACLEGELESFRWNIDDSSTLALITKGGRIEHFSCLLEDEETRNKIEFFAEFSEDLSAMMVTKAPNPFSVSSLKYRDVPLTEDDNEIGRLWHG
ncbi:hypothetical protein EXIGLDRAFT_844728 [Exidia glandulosa HHB12029]|uniref:EF-hand domain-containing protein n=1 Tax=Exidia glandulosa HHB12029 TaxID=1314781 RepID=A0A165BV41_EXIGL|nr:hypothetical protein EXIGLDRAFT_844728 [Exidia glandulosa HHB12029]